MSEKRPKQLELALVALPNQARETKTIKKISKPRKAKVQVKTRQLELKLWQEENPLEEVKKRWSWVEATVWTPRMLAALEKGVKGGKWYSLIDKVIRMENLKSAYKRVAKNKGSAGIDHVNIERFKRHLEKNLKILQRDLSNGTYRPNKIQRK